MAKKSSKGKPSPSFPKVPTKQAPKPAPFGKKGC